MDAPGAGTNPFESPQRPANDSTVPRPGKSRRRGSRIPPIGVGVAMSAFILLAAYIRWQNVTGDRAVVNILTLVCGVISYCILSVWFTFFSGYSPATRWLTTIGIVGAVVLGLVAFRIDQVSGELIPTFRPRWSKKTDELLSKPVVETGDGTTGAADSPTVLTATEHDFPQFLGPGGKAHLDHVQLNRDWDNHPPRQLWRQPIGAGWSAFAVVGERAFTQEQRGEDEYVSCYDVATGKLLWAHATKTRHETVLGGVGPRATPSVHNSRVFAQGATGEVTCLHALTGELIWRDNLLERYGVAPGADERAVAWGRAGSPLIVDDLVVVPGGGPANGTKVSLVAYKQESGEVVWEAGDQQVSFASPILTTLDGVRQIVSVNEATVTGHDPPTGHELWRLEWPGNSTQNANASQPVPVDGDKLFLSKGYGWGAALWQIKSGSPQEIWHDQTLLKTKFTNVVAHNGFVYGLSDGILECAELSSGRSCWKKGRYGQGQILGVGDVILVQVEMGEVAMVEANPEEFKELARFAALDGKTWNNLCLAGSRLLVRNAEEAACYELAVEGKE